MVIEMPQRRESYRTEKEALKAVDRRNKEFGVFAYLAERYPDIHKYVVIVQTPNYYREDLTTISEEEKQLRQDIDRAKRNFY